MLLPLACAPAGPPNLLLVSLDTTRADRTTPYGGEHDATPVLAALAAGGTLFEHAFSNGNESAYSHGALLAGRYASELARPEYRTYALPGSATLVSEALQAAGWQTAMFSAGGHVTAEFGFDQGWDRFRAEAGFASLFDTAPQAIAWIEATDPSRPWFAFLHGYDAHRPYDRSGPWNHAFAAGPGSAVAETLCVSPCLSEMVLRDTLFPELIPSWFTHAGGAEVLSLASYRRLAAAAPERARVPVTEADGAHIRAHYDGGLLYADTMLGAALARLDRAGFLDHTVVVVVSDHGEDLLDHGYMNHRTGLYDSTTRVPLVAWGPGFAAGKRERSLVDGRDVAATLLDVAGVAAPAGMSGRSLRSPDPALDAVFAEGVMDQVSVRTATHRLVYSRAPLDEPGYAEELAAQDPASSRFALFDLRVDPGELRDVRLDDPATTAALRDRLVAWRRGLVVATSPPADVSPEAAASLREHGYWDDPQAGDDATSRLVDGSCRARLQFLASP